MSKLTGAPTLRTQRLLLRGPEREDLPAFTSFMTSAPSLKAQNETASPEQAWFGFLAGIGHWQWHGFGFFIVVDQTTQAPLGRVGMIQHANWPDVELAWHLFEGAEGHGYATEAAFEVKSWARAALGCRTLHSYIDRRNARSQAVARRLGATTDGTLAPHEDASEIWVHDLSSGTARL